MFRAKNGWAGAGRRMRLVGASLIVVFALSAVAAASASASPEFSSTQGFVAKGGKATFEGAGQTVKCKRAESSGVGGLSGTEVGFYVFFSDCVGSRGTVCTLPGENPGVIGLEVQGQLGYISKKKKPKVGVAFAGAIGEELLTVFECVSSTETDYVIAKGNLIGEIGPVNVPTEALNIKFKQAGGVQRPASFEGGPTLALEGYIDPFEYTLTGAIETSAAVQLKTTLILSEPVEIKA